MLETSCHASRTEGVLALSRVAACVEWVIARAIVVGLGLRP